MAISHSFITLSLFDKCKIKSPQASCTQSSYPFHSSNFHLMGGRRNVITICLQQPVSTCQVLAGVADFKTPQQKPSHRIFSRVIEEHLKDTEGTLPLSLQTCEYSCMATLDLVSRYTLKIHTTLKPKNQKRFVISKRKRQRYR